MYKDSETIFIKIIIVGDPGVGKTSILTQYCYKRFEEATRPTIGCDFNTIIHTSKSNKIIKAQLWDIAGQEKFQAVSKLYVRGAQACVIVCDVLEENSLKSSLKWKDLITTDPFFKDNSSEIDDPIPIILVQNKIDLRETEKMKEFMSPEFLQSFAKKNKFFAAFQTSAKTSENLGELFELLVEEILIRKVFNYKKQIDDFEEKKRKKSLSLTQRNQSGKCC